MIDSVCLISRKIVHLPESSEPVVICMTHCEVIPGPERISEDISVSSEDISVSSDNQPTGPEVLVFTSFLFSWRHTLSCLNYLKTISSTLESSVCR